MNILLLVVNILDLIMLAVIVLLTSGRERFAWFCALLYGIVYMLEKYT